MAKYFSVRLQCWEQNHIYWYNHFSIKIMMKIIKTNCRVGRRSCAERMDWSSHAFLSTSRHRMPSGRRFPLFFFPMTLEDIWAKIAFNVCWTHFTPALSVTWNGKLSQREESPQKNDLAPCIANQVTWHLVCGSGQWRQTQQSMALACPSFWEVNKTRIVLVVVNKAFFSCCPTFFLC